MNSNKTLPKEKGRPKARREDGILHPAPEAAVDELTALAAFIEYSDDAIIAKGVTGIITSWNKGAEKIFGYTSGEMLGTSIRRLIPADRDEEETQLLAKIRRGDSVEHFETIRVTKSGRLIAVSVTSSPIKNALGKVIGVSKVARDITARKAEEEALRLFRMLVDQSSDTFEVIDPETARFLDVSEQGPAELGCTRAEYLALRVIDIDPKMTESSWQQFVEKIRLAGSAIGEGSHRRKDGTTFPIEFHAKWVRLDRDYIVTTVRDITARRRGEEALRTSEEKYHGLFEGTRDAIMTLDPPSWRFTSGNPAAVKMFGARDEEEFVSLAPWDASPTYQPDGSASAGKAVEMIETAIREGSHFFEWRHRRMSGEEFPADVLLTRVEQGEKVLLHATVRDISERQQAVAALRASEANMAAAQRLAHLGSWELEITNPDEIDASRLRWSDEMFRIAGYEPGAVPVSNELFFGLVPSDDHEPIRQAVAAAIREHGQYSIVHRLIRPDGVERIVCETAQIFFDEEAGQPTKVIGTAHDITEQKKAEAQLKLLETCVARLNDIVLITEAEPQVEPGPRILFVNDAFVHRTGYTREEVLGRSPRFLQGPKTSRAELDRIGAAMREWKPVRAELINYKKNGEEFCLELDIVPVADPTGWFTHWVAVERDITERKQAEDALRLFRALVDQSNDSFEVIDPETGCFLDVNEKGAHVLGFTRTEFLSLRVCDIDPTITMSTWPQLAEEIRVAGSLSGEGWHQRKDGTTFPVDFNAQWVRLDRDYIVAMVRDITERRRSEAAFRESEQRLRQVVETIREVFWMLDLTLGHLVYVSPNYAAVWGRSCEALYASSHDWLEAIHLDDRERVFQAFKAKASTGTYDEEYRIVRPDGQERWIRDRAFPVKDENGTVYRIAGVAEDITERKKLEQQFLRAQRMESIGTLAGGIAHDLNNVLSPIIMSLDLLKMRFPEPANQELLAVIGASAQRGADMVRQVLSFARGVEGRRMEVQVRHLIQEVEKIAHDTFLKNIQIRTSVPHDLWLVIGDPTQLHQVLLNLCVNARDAMPQGGTLTLSAENRTLDAHYAGLNLEAGPGPYVFIQIEDNGTGISPDVLKKIFDPFFTTKEVGKGTGLGLSTSMAIIKSHGGFIQVYSEPGTGTKFSLYLPAQTEVFGSAPAKAAAEKPRGHGELILIVDDDTSVRQITQETLQAFGYRVVLACDGAEAIAVYATQGEAISVVLTDMTMPIMDGIAAIRVLIKMNPAVRIIGTSGLSEHGYATQSAALGVKHFLPKPYTAEVLLQALQEILAGG